MRDLAGSYILLDFSGGNGLSPQQPLILGEAVPVFKDNDYLLREPGADYWLLSDYYYPQVTDCSCSAVSVTMALNALRSRVAPAEPPLVEADLVAAVNDPPWAERTAPGGSGVTMADLEQIVQTSLDHAGIDGSVTALAAANAASADDLRAALARNEASPDSVMLAYYNQAVVTGDPTGGLHVSPIGAFDAEEDRVLLMDVDRECWVPYWTPVETLHAAFATPDERERGLLANETGGCLLISGA